MVVYPLCKVTLGQAIVVVAAGKVFCLEAAWDGMTQEDKERFRKAAARGTGWIDRKAESATIPEQLGRGGRWCAHKGYSKEAKAAVRDPNAVVFGVVCPSQQSGGTIVVGGRCSDTAQFCGTCGGITEGSRQCSPSGSEFGGEELNIVAADRQCSPSGSECAGEELNIDAADRQLRDEVEERDRRNIDRQLKEESIERDTGWEPWMALGRQTIQRIEDVAERWEGEEEAGVRVATPGEETTGESGTVRGGRPEQRGKGS